MQKLLTAKLAQHEDVRYALISKRNLAIIAKGSEQDQFWGVGRNNTGKNTMSKIWISLRKQLENYVESLKLPM